MSLPRQRFESLLLPVRGGLLRFALQLCGGDAPRADDLLQQAIEVGLARFDQLSAEEAFRAWMSQIVYRTHLNEQKRSSRHERRAERLEDVVVPLPSRSPGPDQTFMAARLGERIAEALAGLPADQARAVWLVDGQGFKYREVAEILEIPRGTAATLVARGRRALQQRLRDVAEAEGVIR